MADGPMTALSQLVDELPVGMVWLSPDGGVASTNAAAQQILDGPSGAIVSQSLQQLCGRAGSPGVAEQVLSLGTVGEVRLILSKGSDGILACIERSGLARLRAEISVLRSMLSATVESAPPIQAIEKALVTLSASLTGSAIAVYSVVGGRSLEALVQVNVPAVQEQRFCTSLDAKQFAVARAVAFDQPVHIPCLARSPFPGDRLVPGADKLVAITIPIHCRGEVVGAIDLCGPPQVLGEGELRLVLGFADTVGALLDRSRREAAVLAERQARQSALSELDDAILELDADGRISLAGGRAHAIFGKSHVSLIGRSIDSWLKPADREQLTHLIASAEDSGHASGELVIQGADAGIPCVVSVGFSQVGSHQMTRVIVRDISARLALESDVRRATDGAVRQDALARIGRLAVCVGHEINNPLAFLKMNLNALRKAIERASPGEDRWSKEELVEMTTEAQEGVRRIATIVQALGGLTTEERPTEDWFSPLHAIEDAIALFRSIDRRHVTVALQSEELPDVPGSATAVGQIVLNLLTNGLAAMGGRGHLDVRCTRDETTIRIAVTDAGHGIPEDIRKFVFDPFFTTRKIGEGMGLGLYVSRRLASNMDGSLDFESSPQGTTFTLVLPVQPRTPKRAVSPLRLVAAN
jgi:PAS domain S-box-containing protein